MNIRDIILVAIAQDGNKIRGRTLLQKRLYFVDVLLNINLGYRPYYYGPYSPAVDDALGDLKGLRFVEERQSSFGASDESGFEVRRYDYELTEDGKTIVNHLKKNSEYNRIILALDRLKAAHEPDYFTLSIAAKAHFILSDKGVPMTREEIIEVAKKLNWKITESQFNNAADFLHRLGLIEDA